MTDRVLLYRDVPDHPKEQPNCLNHLDGWGKLDTLDKAVMVVVVAMWWFVERLTASLATFYSRICSDGGEHWQIGAR